MTLRFALAGLTLLAAAPASAAVDPALAVVSDLHLLQAETAMITSDPSPETHAEKAREIVDRLDAALPAVIARVAGKDATQAGELTAQWEDVKSAYEGSPFGVAFQENTYDTNLTARYNSGSVTLLQALDEPARAAAAADPLTDLRFRVLRAVSSYLQVSTGLVGGTSLSANDEGNDIQAAVAAIDKALAGMRSRYAGKKDQAALLQQATTRWQFIRPTLLRTGGQSTPFIVYTHGLATVRTLEKLQAP